MPSYQALTIIVAVAVIGPLLLGLAPRLPLPAPALEILGGIVLGPSVLDLVRIDETVSAVALLGLAFLLFLAGTEVDVARLRDRVAAGALAVSAVLGLSIGLGLQAVGLVRSAGFLAIALLATSLGLVVPVLVDARLLSSPTGQLVVANSSLAEVGAVLLLSLFFTGSATGPAGRVQLLAVFLLLLLVVVAGSRRAGMSPRLSVLVGRLADTSAQLRVRLAVLLLVGLAAVAETFGLEGIFGAFVAGVLLRVADPAAELGHPQLLVKLQALGYGFFVPVFYVSSGVRFDVAALTADLSSLGKVPLFLACLLLVRGAPALLYRSLALRDRLAAGLLQATSLPFLVAATAIGVQVGAVGVSSATALVGAGLLSVLIFPAVAVALHGLHLTGARGRGSTAGSPAVPPTAST